MKPTWCSYTDVRVPVANTVGEKSTDGWSIGRYLLAHERMSGGSLGTTQNHSAAAQRDRNPGWAVRWAALNPENRILLIDIAAIEMELRTLEAFNMRAIDKFSRDGELGGKALGSRGQHLQNSQQRNFTTLAWS